MSLILTLGFNRMSASGDLRSDFYLFLYVSMNQLWKSLLLFLLYIYLYYYTIILRGGGAAEL